MGQPDPRVCWGGSSDPDMALDFPSISFYPFMDPLTLGLYLDQISVAHLFVFSPLCKIYPKKITIVPYTLLNAMFSFKRGGGSADPVCAPPPHFICFILCLFVFCLLINSSFIHLLSTCLLSHLLYFYYIVILNFLCFFSLKEFTEKIKKKEMSELSNDLFV